MRGSTVKLINKFVHQLIEQTPEDQITKSKQQLVKETRVMWKTGKQAQKFIHKVVNGEYA
jgi:hypothetical protein